MANRHKKYFLISFIFHVIILLVIILGFDFTTPLSVLENTNKNDVITAVVLGDTPDSKILPQKITAPQPSVQPKSELKSQPKIQKNVIALEKKTILKKPQPSPKEWFGKNLLADIKKENDKQKKIKQKKLKTQFEKTLQDQAEKSLRQQLLDEEIKLKGTETRQSQGEVNKYKALILQIISEHWIVPPQANKKLYCELVIHLAPTGLVLDVQIAKSSGDPSLDSSARAAVLNASPLPVPKNIAAFEPFRQFVLKVKPENVITE